MHCDSEFPQHELTFVSQNDTGNKGEEYTLYVSTIFIVALPLSEDKTALRIYTLPNVKLY